jgi:broad specificity phosphatase PhoE
MLGPHPRPSPAGGRGSFVAGSSIVIRVAFLRHAATAWNAERRLQGRRDLPLSADGRAAVAGWWLPEEVAGWRWTTSPLVRARETAALLGFPEAAAEPLLIEMDWGGWEGRTVAALRSALGPAMAAAEAKGLDLRPPGGETPREVRERVRRFFRKTAAAAAESGPTVAVTHKGVIRAALALATGWDMRSEPPVRLRWDALHLFAVATDGTPSVDRLNISLAGS